MSPAARMFWLAIAHGTRPGEAKGLLMAWIGWENLAKWLWPLEEIPGASHGIFKIQRVTYTGKRVRLRDGTEVGPGDPVLELHTDNAVCLSISEAGQLVRVAAAREDMRALARHLMSCEELRDIRAIFGLTLLRTFAERLGLLARECEPGIRLKFEGMYMRGLLLVYTPDGLLRLRKGTAVNSMPCHVWISRDELIRRYGDKLPEIMEHPGR